MLGFANQSRPDLSRFEAMSTDELKEILRNDAFAKEDDNTTDISAILYISEIVAEREGTPDSKAAWAEFERSYLPDADKGPNLYELIAAEERPVASRPRRIRRRSRVLRLALAAAAVMVLAVSAAFAVSHAGWFRAWNIDYLWSKLARSEQSAQTEAMPKPDYYDEMAEALEAIGAPDHMIPLWLPEGYEMAECVSMDYSYYTALTVSFRDKNSGEIIFAFSGYATEDFSSSYVADSTSLFTKDNGDPDIFTAGGVDHTILTNMDSYESFWWRESFECSISGFESRDDLIKTIESMYMEVMK